MTIKLADKISLLIRRTAHLLKACEISIISLVYSNKAFIPTYHCPTPPDLLKTILHPHNLLRTTPPYLVICSTHPGIISLPPDLLRASCYIQFNFFNLLLFSRLSITNPFITSTFRSTPFSSTFPRCSTYRPLCLTGIKSEFKWMGLENYFQMYS